MVETGATGLGSAQQAIQHRTGHHIHIVLHDVGIFPGNATIIVAFDCVEQVVFTALAATGVISGIARGSNQCALAHKFYETTRTLFHEEARPYLHGEIVGIGLLLQNRFNGETERNGELLSLMERYGMPHCITDIGIPRTEQAMAEYADRLKNSSAIEKGNADECARLEEALRYLWETV
jgi:glycerol dehydrogenase-like iron-containing ADH family enzyme